MGEADSTDSVKSTESDDPTPETGTTCDDCGTHWPQTFDLTEHKRRWCSVPKCGDVHEAEDAEARAVVRRIPVASWDVTVWLPIPDHTVTGTVDIADRQRIVREVLAAARLDTPLLRSARSLSFDERRRLAAQVFGIETQLLLGTMGESGPVRYRVADLFHDDGSAARKAAAELAISDNYGDDDVPN